MKINGYTTKVSDIARLVTLIKKLKEKNSNLN